MINKRELEIYLHIPFCVRKCYYCDFLSAQADEETKDKYMDALYREKPEKLCKVLAFIRKNYPVSPNAEITIEINPGTVEENQLVQYRKAGVNRLSIGLQSSNNDELKRIGRIHTWEQFLQTYRNAIQAGFENINVDIMSTLPGQRFEDYKETLMKVTGLVPKPTHISAYSLIIEEGTALYQMVEKGLLDEPDEEVDRKMYHETKNILQQAGYLRYEISNYAKKGYQCLHNCGYWTGREYVGFGTGAASYLEKTRFKNMDDLKIYLEQPLECRSDVHKLSEEEQMEEFMFLGLRMTEGISVSEFEKRFHVQIMDVYDEVIHNSIQDGLLMYYGQDRLALTDKGLDLSNYCMARFLLT